MPLDRQKVTVTLPKGLLERLYKTVPSRKRSLFIKEATEKHLDLVEQTAALEETAGAWSLERHLDMQDEGINERLKESRQSWG